VVLRTAYNAMKQHLAALWAERSAQCPLGSPYDALILASIVEKETGQEADRWEVGAVFLNRLRAGMKLQSDPTVIYGLGERFDGDLRRTDLRRQFAHLNDAACLIDRVARQQGLRRGHVVHFDTHISHDVAADRRRVAIPLQANALPDRRSAAQYAFVVQAVDVGLPGRRVGGLGLVHQIDKVGHA